MLYLHLPVKKLSSVVLLLIAFALLGKTAITSFCPQVLTYAVATADLAEENMEEDESGEDDKVLGQRSAAASAHPESQRLFTPLVFHVLSHAREILAPPPQA